MQHPIYLISHKVLHWGTIGVPWITLTLHFRLQQLTSVVGAHLLAAALDVPVVFLFAADVVAIGGVDDDAVVESWNTHKKIVRNVNETNTAKHRGENKRKLY